MSHYDVYFAFGKTGTYMLDHQKGTVEQNIPDGLKKTLREHTLSKIVTLAMDANDNYFCYWVTKNGAERWAHSYRLENQYKVFHEFWTKKRNKSAVGVTFGPTLGSSITWGPKGGWATNGLDMDWIRARVTRVTIRCAAYGLNNAQVFIFTDGTFSCNRLGLYPDLEVLLKKQNRGDVVFVAMNPYRGNEYFVVLANATVYIRASAVVERDVANVLEAYPSMEVISSTLVKRNTTVTISAGLPKETRRKEFLSGIMKSVASAATTALVSAAFGACNVM